jgi:hypothetical protein
MDERIDGQLGLVVLYEGPSPTLECASIPNPTSDLRMLIQRISVVAVHGLGANPDWAWVRKVKERDTDKERKVNWLADLDMLPAKIPDARIMTFNYESRWHKDAPKQRRSLCADQLLTALDNKRNEVNIIGLRFLAELTLNVSQEKDTKHRPLVFIGHSFGGIVVEQVGAALR